MGKKVHKRMNGEEVKIHQHDNYQMPGAYKQDGDKNQNQPMFRMGKPYEMGMSMRGPLDKHGKVFPNSWEEEDVKRGRKEMEEGHYKHGEDLFDDAHGSWNWGKSHHSTGTEMRGPLNNDKKKNKKASRKTRRMLKKFAHDNAKSIMAVIKDNKSKGAEMRGPLNQNTYQQSSFEAMSEEEFKKRQNERNAKKAAKQGSAEAAAEGAGELGKNQELKTKMERKITEKKPKKA